MWKSSCKLLICDSSVISSTESVLVHLFLVCDPKLVKLKKVKSGQGVHWNFCLVKEITNIAGWMRLGDVCGDKVSLMMTKCPHIPTVCC